MNTSFRNPPDNLRLRENAPARRLCPQIVLIGLVMAMTPFAWAGPPRTAQSLPDLAAPGLEGSLPDLRGKVVLLDFWASWCAPCKKSFPVMKELQEKFGPRGFVVLAISVDENKNDMEAFLRKSPPTFAVLRDAKGRLAEKMGVEKMPTSFLVRADGTVAGVHSGFDGESTRKEYLAEVEAALQSAGK